MSTKKDSRSSRKPTLLIDRCITPGTGQSFEKFGYKVVLMRDYYGKTREQFVEDTTWIQDAHEHGWTVITANPRILSTPHEIDLIEQLGVNVFCIGNPQGNRETRSMIIGRHLLTIQRRWKLEGPTFWRLYPHQILKDVG